MEEQPQKRRKLVKRDRRQKPEIVDHSNSPNVRPLHSTPREPLNRGENSQKREFDKEIRRIPIERIENPKHHDRIVYDDEAIHDLAANMKELGLLSPVLLRKRGSKFQRIFGFRRIEAAKLLGWHEIDAIVINELHSSTAALMMLSENLYHVKPNDYDQLLTILDYIDIDFGLGRDELVHKIKYTQKKEAKHVLIKDVEIPVEKFVAKLESMLAPLKGFTVPTLVHRFRILKIHPKLISAIQNKTIAYTTAISLDRIKDEQVLLDLLDRAIKEELTLREVDKLVKEFLDKERAKAEAPIDAQAKEAKQVLEQVSIEAIGKLPLKQQKVAYSLLKKLGKVLGASRD